MSKSSSTKSNTVNEVIASALESKQRAEAEQQLAIDVVESDLAKLREKLAKLDDQRKHLLQQIADDEGVLRQLQGKAPRARIEGRAPTSLDEPVDVVGVPERMLIALHGKGIRVFADLAGFTAEELFGIKHLSRKTAQRLLEAFQALGGTLKAA